MNRDRIKILGVCSEACKLRDELLRLLNASGVDDTEELLFMLDKLRSKIERTGETWNPVLGCTRVSEGCRNCYAERQSGRLANMAVADEQLGKNPGRKADYKLVVLGSGTGPNFRAMERWNNEIRCIGEALEDPLRWRKPRTVFVCSMSDLFHPEVPFEFIHRIFATMALCPQHTFQILTKRPERMAAFLADLDNGVAIVEAIGELLAKRRGQVACYAAKYNQPLPNVWLGTSVEDQAAADERIPHLLKCPAAVRFLSCEPLLGPMDLRQIAGNTSDEQESEVLYFPLAGEVTFVSTNEPIAMRNGGIDWAIVGGESGPRARPCNIDWIRSIRDQCQGAGVPVFVKQLGRCIEARNDSCHEWPRDGDEWVYCSDGPQHNAYQGEMITFQINDSKGGNPNEWPEDLRVRQMPVSATLPAPPMRPHERRVNDG